MKALYRASSGRLTFEIVADTDRELFSRIAVVQDVFDGEKACGKCGCPEIRFLQRHVESFDYYELECTNRNCRARFSFGQHKQGGTLFPKRRSDSGDLLPHGGWAPYEPAAKGAA